MTISGWGSFPWGSGEIGAGGSPLPALTLFTREMGRGQGRSAPVNHPPREGNYLVVLGSDKPNQRGRLATADFIRISQINDTGGAALVRPRLYVRPPTDVPATAAWTCRMRVDGVAVASFLVDRERSVEDLVVNASGIAGSFELSFELVILGTGGPWEVELPAVYVDAITLESPARPLLANRMPEPDEREVPRDTLIAVDVIDTTSSGIAVAATQVFVNGTLAFSGGTFQVGFNGAGSATSSLDGGRTRRIIIDRTTSFDSEQQVEVQVISATNDGLPLNQRYAFYIEDVTPPAVVSAQAVNDSVVKVTFDEAIDPASVASGWAFEIVAGHPAVWVLPAKVVAVSDRSFEVTTDIPMTARATYRVRTTTATDLFGNVAAAPTNEAEFVAAGDQAPGRDFHVKELLPPINLEWDESGDYLRFMGIFQEVTELLLRRIDSWPDIFDVDVAPEIFVDAMLQDLGNPFTFSLTLNEKRKLAKLLVPIYRSKGLQRGIISAVRLFMGIETTIEYPAFRGLRLGSARIGSTFRLSGEGYGAYAYEIHVPVALTDTQRERIRAIATFMQVAHEHLHAIVEPAGPSEFIDHLQLGRSRLGTEWKLH